MARTRLQRPTDSELEILNVLWERGPSTVREVQEVLAETRENGYTTVLKILQIMAGKGLVERDEGQKAHVYRAVGEREKTQRLLVNDLVDRAFDGSAAGLVVSALGSKRASSAELAEIRALLDRYEGRKR